MSEFVFYHPEELPEAPITDPAWYHLGYRTWIVRAYHLLMQIGFPCTMSNKFPDQGVVIGFRTTIPNNVRPTHKRFLVCVQADYTPLTYSNVDIVQNPAQEGLRRGKARYFIPFFPQIGLVPRDAVHGDRFCKVAYFGNLYGLNRSPVIESPDFRKWLLEHGFEFVLADQPSQWHDYSDIDAVIAIRSFSSLHNHKPASKLVNAWIAGVPAVLGPESAYRALRRSDLDYIEVSSVEETQKALMVLRENLELRRKMVKNGRMRAIEYSLESVTYLWANLLGGPIRNQAEQWFSKSDLRNRYFLMRALGGGVIDYAECVVQQRGAIGALSHGLQRPVELAARVLQRHTGTK